jgi:hypothetical protein
LLKKDSGNSCARVVKELKIDAAGRLASTVAVMFAVAFLQGFARIMQDRGSAPRDKVDRNRCVLLRN